MLTPPLASSVSISLPVNVRPAYITCPWGSNQHHNVTHLCRQQQPVATVRGECDAAAAAVWQQASSSYHGLHRLPALGFRSRQEEILGIPPEIHPQVDVEVHGDACQSAKACYTRRGSGVLVRPTEPIWVNLSRMAALWFGDLATPTPHHVSGTEVVSALKNKNKYRAAHVTVLTARGRQSSARQRPVLKAKFVFFFSFFFGRIVQSNAIQQSTQ